MKYVLDASIAVAAARANEPLHKVARAKLELIEQGVDSIVVPALFEVEVAASLARRGLPTADVNFYVDALMARAEIRTIGPRRAREVRTLAIAAQLRAADATYVWVAQRAGIPLLTDDAEILTRAANYCVVQALVP
jgi:predicted nucleic acid-binding protein